MNQAEPNLGSIQRTAWIVGAVGLIGCVLGILIDPTQFFRSYLYGYLFGVSLTLGCSSLLMLHHLVGGSWGFGIQRLLEAGVRLFPLMAILFVPLVFGLKALYPWARPELLADDTLLQHKQAYLNAPFFLIRAGLYFGVWTGVGYALNRWSPRQDATSGDRLTSRIKRLSGFGLVAYGGTVTFATIDWGMSLEPHWFSTMYGVIFIIGNALTTMALMIVMLGLVSRQKPLSNLVSAQHFHDLGNLLLAFVMLWAYIAFSQYLIIWSGNLAEEATWYAPRMAGGWKPVAMMLIGFHFIVPFLLLLSRNTKRRTQAITAVALFVLAMRLVDLFWLVAPAFHKEGFHLHWLDIAAPLGVGGLWLGVFIWQLQKRPLLPMGDPRLVEILSQREDAHHA